MKIRKLNSIKWHQCEDVGLEDKDLQCDLKAQYDADGAYLCSFHTNKLEEEVEES